MSVLFVMLVYWCRSARRRVELISCRHHLQCGPIRSDMRGDDEAVTGRFSDRARMNVACVKSWLRGGYALEIFCLSDGESR